jgi:hypothetical protein
MALLAFQLVADAHVDGCPAAGEENLVAAAAEFRDRGRLGAKIELRAAG